MAIYDRAINTTNEPIDSTSWTSCCCASIIRQQNIFRWLKSVVRKVLLAEFSVLLIFADAVFTLIIMFITIAIIAAVVFVTVMTNTNIWPGFQKSKFTFRKYITVLTREDYRSICSARALITGSKNSDNTVELNVIQTTGIRVLPVKRLMLISPACSSI